VSVHFYHYNISYSVQSIRRRNDDGQSPRSIVQTYIIRFVRARVYNIYLPRVGYNSFNYLFSVHSHLRVANFGLKQYFSTRFRLTSAWTFDEFSRARPLTVNKGRVSDSVSAFSGLRVNIAPQRIPKILAAATDKTNVYATRARHPGCICYIYLPGARARCLIFELLSCCAHIRVVQSNIFV